MNIHEIIPREKVGDVFFDADENSLIALGYKEDKAKFDETLSWHTYTKYDGLECYVKDRKIVCIACFANCYFKGSNLIEKTIDQLISICGDPEEIGESVWVSDDIQQTPYEYFSYGLQVWIESGKVVSVFCNAVY